MKKGLVLFTVFCLQSCSDQTETEAYEGVPGVWMDRVNIL